MNPSEKLLSFPAQLGQIPLDCHRLAEQKLTGSPSSDGQFSCIRRKVAMSYGIPFSKLQCTVPSALHYMTQKAFSSVGVWISPSRAEG